MIEYRGIGPEKGKRVSSEDALAYAMSHCGIMPFDTNMPEYNEFCEFLVDWYFSGNWRKKKVE